MTKIALDIGHGEDTYNRTGSKGVLGLEEHHFNAAVGIELKKLLNHNGFDVFFTQLPFANDVGLKYRTDLANRERADLFFSIHADANANKQIEGHWAFYWSTSSDGKRLAELLNEEMNRIVGTPPVGTGIKACRSDVSWPNFHVIRETKMVAVLHEHEFMTNPAGLKRLQSVEFRKKCAEADARAICRYYGVTFKPLSAVSEKDYHGHWAEKSIEKAIIKGVMSGYPDASFRPEQMVTRAELASMLDRLKLLN
ncbi:N-acetylmuramoyl-L-alanine amidase [Bacillus tianshenii]|nr:N-acetylmuramoyl-L-alanine amidase [Bacillus tianshenii]